MEALEAILPLLLAVFLFHIAMQILTFLLPYLFFAGLIVLAVWALIVAFKEREAIARWYYFTFSPHPAEPVVRACVAGGRPIEGEHLAAILGEVPPDHRILREVRIEQGEQLIAEMQRACEQLMREATLPVEVGNAHAAFIGIQEAIALAAIALERAKAASQASKSALGR